jgi:hypothetical protein
MAAPAPSSDQVPYWGPGPRPGTHNCATQHLGYPLRNSLRIPEIYSYPAYSIVHSMVAMKRQVHDVNPNQELANAYREVAGMTDNVDGMANMMISDIRETFDKWAEIIDRRYLNGAFLLTPGQRGDDRELRLVVGTCFLPLSNANGKDAFTTDINITSRAIFITVRDKENDNRRRSASSFFVLLVREMARAYTGLFYNYCTNNYFENPDREFLENGCTGALWFRVFYTLASMIKTTIPELGPAFEAELDRPRRRADLRAEMEWRFRYFKGTVPLPSWQSIATVRRRTEVGLLYKIAHPMFSYADAIEGDYLLLVVYMVVAAIVLANVYIFGMIFLARGVLREGS